MRDVVNSALFYHYHEQGTNLLSSYSFIFWLPRFPFASNQALHEHNHLSVQVTPRPGLLREPCNYPTANTVSLLLSASAYFNQKAPEERQGGHSGTKEIFFWKKVLLLSQLLHNSLKGKLISRGRGDGWEREACAVGENRIDSLYLHAGVACASLPTTSGSLSQIMCSLLLEIALVTQIAEDSAFAVRWVSTHWDLHFWL